MYTNLLVDFGKSTFVFACMRYSAMHDKIHVSIQGPNELDWNAVGDGVEE